MSDSRGSRRQRGYGPAHIRLREQWAPLVAAGRVNCARCGKPIPPRADWHLGHDDDDRTKYRGPEHAACNLGGPRRRRADPTPPPAADSPPMAPPDNPQCAVVVGAYIWAPSDRRWMTVEAASRMVVPFDSDGWR